jgi:cyclase
MLKKRLIPCMLLQNGFLVQSIKFQKYLIVGKPKFTIERFINWDVDEIIFLDISATKENRGPDLEIIAETAKGCFVPLTVGGGIHTLKDIRNVLKAGADKVSINTEAIKRPKFITESSEVFGSQCIVISIDVKINDDGEYEVFIDSGKEPTGLEPIEWAKEVEELGGGEIFLTSIDRDGTKEGYDIDLIKSVSNSVDIPVIACGGVGKMQDFADGILKGNASAVSAANIFQHSEHSTLRAKAAMKLAGIDVRISTSATYLENIY